VAVFLNSAPFHHFIGLVRESSIGRLPHPFLEMILFAGAVLEYFDTIRSDVDSPAVSNEPRINNAAENNTLCILIYYLLTNLPSALVFRLSDINFARFEIDFIKLATR
jgi:hypothetical protein